LSAVEVQIAYRLKIIVNVKNREISFRLIFISSQRILKTACLLSAEPATLGILKAFCTLQIHFFDSLPKKCGAYAQSPRKCSNIEILAKIEGKESQFCWKIDQGHIRF
jgi:hypothetical protein